MPKLVWDEAGKHYFETGVDHGVLFVADDTGNYGHGVVWNGLSTVTESPEGADETAIYADNTKYLSLRSAENFKATIEAYTYPDEWEECDGSKSAAEGVKVAQQPRKKFCFSYRTKVGNDVNPEAGYKIHIIYGATAAPTSRAYESVNDSPAAMTMSWEISTTPIAFANHEGLNPTAHIEIDSTKVDAEKLAAFEKVFYGSDEASGQSTLVLPDELLTMFAA